jgi:asparagine synthase (glutamine-hydrolysing)
MSGICGIVNFDGKPVDPELLRKMAEASAYRGPDGINYWIDGNVGMAHLALHTTPESVREEQPLVNRREDLVLVADARVDNRPELIHTLTAKGYLQQENPTDADLILAAYECWGEGCPEHVIGDFAFAIWDASRQILFCARDSVGVRGFCFSLDDKTFRFGTEVGQVLADERVCRDLDGYAISDHLTSNFHYGWRTMFAAVRRLAPGHCMTLGAQGPRAWRYWKPDRVSPIRYKTEEEYIEHFRELFFRCVADRLRSVKGTVAILTSGGLDSSSIAAVAQYLYADSQVSSRPIAYTYVFDRFEECDEREYSSLLLAETDIELHQIRAEQFHLLDHEQFYEPLLETPMIDQGSLGQYVLEQARERGCDALITGRGGDDMFGAARLQYVDHVRSVRWWKLWPWLVHGRREGRSWASLVWRLILRPLLPRRFRYQVDRWLGVRHQWHLRPWIHPELIEKTRPLERLLQQRHSGHFRRFVRQKQYEWFVDPVQLGDYIQAYSRRAAGCGLDMRLPFLDRRLAEFVLAVPVELSARPGHGNTKWILRQAMTDVLPEKIRCRRNKSNWHSYFEHMLQSQIREEVRALLTDGRIGHLGLVCEERLLDEFEAYCRGRVSYQETASFLRPVFLERWLQTHMSEETTIRYGQLSFWQLQ